MIQGGPPQLRDVVLIGGGHAHALVARMWGMEPLPGARLTILNPAPAAPYTGMLPGLIAGHYARDEIMIDLIRLGGFAGARVILDRAVGIDRAARVIHLQDRPPLRYDVASIDIGIGSGLPQVPGYAEHGVAAKPLGDFAQRWGEFVTRALPAPRVVIIGAGLGGVELALACAHRLRQTGATPAITLLERGPRALPHIGEAARLSLLTELARAGVLILTGAEPARIEDGAVQLQDGRGLGSDFTLSAAGSRPQDWLAETGLVLQDGFVTVSPTLQTSDPMIFAAGDCMHMPFAPRPKAGVYAVRAAPILLHNLRAALAGGRMRRFRPQRDYLKLVSLGDKRAVADKFGLRSGGAWLWRLKDDIDRRFMAKFADYPAMPRPKAPAQSVKGLAQMLAEQPTCAGCGSKVGPWALGQALTGLPGSDRADLVNGPGDDAAILDFGTQRQVLTTDHLRSFTQDPRLLAEVAAVHALGDVWAMGAAPQAALAQIILPPLSPELQQDMLADIMQAAAQVFADAGASIVGGHTTIGAELTLGFTVTGLVQTPLTKGGGQPGDALILTKALGTGTILAAEMARARLPGLILGEAVVSCHAAMRRPLGPAAAILSPVAHAMTDVTGFGLAGHLLELLDASGCGAELALDAIPLLPGAAALAAAGYASSLAPQNRAMTDWKVSDHSGTGLRHIGPDTPRRALLDDPQTGGPLLAAVPADRAAAILADLSAIGETAAIIGHLVAGSPRITLI
ncbi:MAG: selenide, water dikinase SelD [Rhodobacteraceae bacterium PARR1]|nr:MAG: selenide, water dikinase SelD [Rhodobacteraceae bacterium PARR1]